MSVRVSLESLCSASPPSLRRPVGSGTISARLKCVQAHVNVARAAVSMLDGACMHVLTRAPKHAGACSQAPLQAAPGAAGDGLVTYLLLEQREDLLAVVAHCSHPAPLQHATRCCQTRYSGRHDMRMYR